MKNILKLEFKDVLDYIFKKLKDTNLINSETTIVMPMLEYGLNEVVNYAIINNIKLTLCIFNSAENVIEQSNNNIQIIAIPSSMMIDDLIEMAKDMALEIENSYLLSPFLNRDFESYFYKVLAKKIDNDYPDINYLSIPIIYGDLISGLAKYFKIKKDCYIKGVIYKDFDYKLDLDLIDQVTKDNRIDDNLFKK